MNNEAILVRVQSAIENFESVQEVKDLLDTMISEIQAIKVVNGKSIEYHICTEEGKVGRAVTGTPIGENLAIRKVHIGYKLDLVKLGIGVKSRNRKAPLVRLAIAMIDELGESTLSQDAKYIKSRIAKNEKLVDYINSDLDVSFKKITRKTP